MSTTTTTPIRLPSISELTSRNTSISQFSPRLTTPTTSTSSSTATRILPSISSSPKVVSATSPFKYQPLQPSSTNYTTNAASHQINGLPRITSPALPPSSTNNTKSLQPLPPASSINRVINTPPQQQQHPSISASTSPSINHQYYQYQQPPPPPPQPVQQQQQYIPTQQYYSQPIYYQGPPPPPGTIMTMVPQPQHQQRPVSVTPEIVNKPTNKCHRCGTTETPEWRRGPKGVRTLCNACGLFHAKLVKRKGAALAAEEVLNNKVTKGKNGRRISIKKHLLNESLKNNSSHLLHNNGEIPNYYNPNHYQPQPIQQQVIPGKIHGVALPPPLGYGQPPIYTNTAGASQIPLIRH
ncbi:BRG1 Biofilm regulator 1 [Candida maltosa Xu316]